MKVLVIADENALVTVYKADTKEDLDFAVYEYFKYLLPYIQGDDDFMNSIETNNISNLYLKFQNQEQDNLRIDSYEILKVVTK